MAEAYPSFITVNSEPVHHVDPTRGAVHGGGQWNTPRPFPGPSYPHAHGMYPTSTPISYPPN
jgi:hypothetical protein